MSRPKIKLADGCPGCGTRWDEPGAEGQCSRCKRCLECCGREAVPYSCGFKFARRTARDRGYPARSKAAYDRWEGNVKILGHNRRIV